MITPTGSLPRGFVAIQASLRPSSHPCQTNRNTHTAANEAQRKTFECLIAAGEVIVNTVDGQSKELISLVGWGSYFTQCLSPFVSHHLLQTPHLMQ